MIDCLCTWSRRTKGICKAGIHDGTIHILMAGATFQHMKRNSHHRPMAHGGRVILGSGGGHRTSKPSATRLPGLGPAKMKKNGITHKSSVRGFRVAWLGTNSPLVTPGFLAEGGVLHMTREHSAITLHSRECAGARCSVLCAPR
jgi:hypothetical protein